MTASKPTVTFLNNMVGEIEPALDRYVEWGVKDLDLKSRIYGKDVMALSSEELCRLAGAVEQRGLQTYCLSTVLFHQQIALGESHFRQVELGGVAHALEVARVLKPTFVRLLDPRGSGRFPDWMIALYREAADQISAAGFATTIENECHDCLFGDPDNIVDFFQRLDRPGTVSFTWDIQNLWSNGTFPSLEVYNRLKPWIRYVHFKGGQSETPGGALKWYAPLAEASWPVREIAQAIARDGLAPVWCLNASHGSRKQPSDLVSDTHADLMFLRQVIREA